MANDLIRKFQDPRWRARELSILEDALHKCRFCGDDGPKANRVHVAFYPKGKDPWEFPEACFIPLCETCLNERRSFENAIREKWGSLTNTELGIIADAFDFASRMSNSRVKSFHRFRDQLSQGFGDEQSPQDYEDNSEDEF